MLWLATSVDLMVPETIIEDAKNLLEHIWGPNRPTLVVPPGLELNSYPRVCMARLDGPAIPEFDGTYLFVIWFVNEDPTTPLQDALAHVAQHGGWDSLSRGYHF